MRFKQPDENSEKSGDARLQTIRFVSAELIQQISHVEIRVADNDMACPSPSRTKSFNPFLPPNRPEKVRVLGLSMSYDIITKGHGGELKVSTREGEGTTFCILIPTN